MSVFLNLKSQLQTETIFVSHCKITHFYIIYLIFLTINLSKIPQSAM